MSSNQFDQHRVLVAPLFHFGRDDLMLAGGKGANLGELSRAGFDVPPGFIITTVAYDLLLQENDFQPRLAAPILSTASRMHPPTFGTRWQKNWDGTYKLRSGCRRWNSLRMSLASAPRVPHQAT